MLREQPVTTVITALPLPQGGWSAALRSEFLMPGVGLTASVASGEALCAGIPSHCLLSSAGGGGGGTQLFLSFNLQASHLEIL